MLFVMKTRLRRN